MTAQMSTRHRGRRNPNHFRLHVQTILTPRIADRCSGQRTMNGAFGAEVSLPPGSYFSFVGKKKRTTRCDAGADCVILMDARGKWDVVPIETAK